jgi:hypothetical protein
MTEQWLPVVGYEGYYEVSDQGQVRSIDRQVPATVYGKDIVRNMRGRIIKPRLGHGYPTVTLSKNSIHEHRRIHRLMLLAFAGPCPDGMEGCHINDSRTDNRLENLRWGTRSDNMQDALRNGTHPTGSKTHCKRGHKFTPDNTYNNGGNRGCKTCSRDQGREKAREKYGWKPRVYWEDTTHCDNGHLKTPENTYIQPSNGGRSCRICRAEHSRRRYQASLAR